jgi:hypothetical protein
MTKEQLDVIVGLIAGTQTAIIVLAAALKHNGVPLDLGALAAHFDRSAEAVPTGARNQKLISMVLRHVATGLRDPGVNPAEEISRLLH